MKREDKPKTIEMEEAVKEANRQRDYMQKTVITLKKTLKGWLVGGVELS